MEMSFDHLKTSNKICDSMFTTWRQQQSVIFKVLTKEFLLLKIFKTRSTKKLSRNKGYGKF